MVVTRNRHFHGTMRIVVHNHSNVGIGITIRIRLGVVTGLGATRRRRKILTNRIAVVGSCVVVDILVATIHRGALVVVEREKEVVRPPWPEGPTTGNIVVKAKGGRVEDDRILTVTREMMIVRRHLIPPLLRGNEDDGVEVGVRRIAADEVIVLVPDDDDVAVLPPIAVRVAGASAEVEAVGAPVEVAVGALVARLLPEEGDLDTSSLIWLIWGYVLLRGSNQNNPVEVVRVVGEELVRVHGRY